MAEATRRFRRRRVGNRLRSYPKSAFALAVFGSPPSGSTLAAAWRSPGEARWCYHNVLSCYVQMTVAYDGGNQSSGLLVSTPRSAGRLIPAFNRTQTAHLVLVAQSRRSASWILQNSRRISALSDMKPSIASSLGAPCYQTLREGDVRGILTALRDRGSDDLSRVAKFTYRSAADPCCGRLRTDDKRQAERARELVGAGDAGQGGRREGPRFHEGEGTERSRHRRGDAPRGGRCHRGRSCRATLCTAVSAGRPPEIGVWRSTPARLDSMFDTARLGLSEPKPCRGSLVAASEWIAGPIPTASAGCSPTPPGIGIGGG